MTTADMRSDGLSPRSEPVYILCVRLLLCTEPDQGARHTQRCNLPLVAFRAAASTHWPRTGHAVYVRVLSELARSHLDSMEAPGPLSRVLRYSCAMYIQVTQYISLSNVCMRPPSQANQCTLYARDTCMSSFCTPPHPLPYDRAIASLPAQWTDLQIPHAPGGRHNIHWLYTGCPPSETHLYL